MRCVVQVPRDDVRARRERRVGVAAPDDGVREQVLVLRIDLRRAGRERVARVEHRREHLVLHVDERGGLARRAPVDGGHRREDVADAAHLFALGDEARPVVVDQAVPALAGDVGGRDDRDDAGMRPRARRVDAPHPGARVRRQHDGAVQQARPRQVVDVGPLAERPGRAPGSARAARRRRSRRSAAGIASPRRALAISSMASTIFT